LRVSVVLDPGIGFGKKVQHNLSLALHRRLQLGYPIRWEIAKALGSRLPAQRRPPEARLYGSLAVAAWCHAHHVEMIRVHDVRETVELFRVLDAIEDPAPHRPKG
jgi:dihydropteroate synthase